MRKIILLLIVSAFCFSSCLYMNRYGQVIYAPSEFIEIEAVKGNVGVTFQEIYDPNSETPLVATVTTNDQTVIHQKESTTISQGTVYGRKLKYGYTLFVTVQSLSPDEEQIEIKITTPNGKSTNYKLNSSPIGSTTFTFSNKLNKLY